MRSRILCSLILVLVVMPTAPLEAQSDPTPPLQRPAESASNQSNFCHGEYALCITAPCKPIPTLDRLSNYYVEKALCECDVVTGWSMGPGSCRDRGPTTPAGSDRTFLISTYSNAYNGAVAPDVDNKVLQCPADTEWAWCYGAPCVVDEDDPTKAICTCPVVTSAANLLGDCDTGMCDQIWSAAVPAGDCFANWNYFDWMTANGFESPPVANACTTGQPICTRPPEASSPSSR